MGTERLEFPEEYAMEIVAVIREGLKTAKASKVAEYQLEKWCRKMERYMRPKGRKRNLLDKEEKNIAAREERIGDR